MYFFSFFGPIKIRTCSDPFQPHLNLPPQVNLVAYGLNVLFTYGIGVAGLFNLPDNTVLSEKYQTLVTPIGWAFSIWGPIFISDALFTLAQLLPKYRDNAIVVDGVGYWYAAVCLAQIFWTLSFSLEVRTRENWGELRTLII